MKKHAKFHTAELVAAAITSSSLFKKLSFMLLTVKGYTSIYKKCPAKFSRQFHSNFIYISMFSINEQTVVNDVIT